MDKIGAKAGMRTAVLGVVDKTLSAELAEKGAVPVAELSNLDLLFYAADTAAELAGSRGWSRCFRRRARCGSSLARARRPPSRTSRSWLRQRRTDWWTNKVVAFSPTHTSLRFVRRKAEA
jgi:hypothetical protein